MFFFFSFNRKTYPDQENDGEVNSIELNVKDLKFDISKLENKETKPIESNDSNDKQNKDDQMNYFIDDENYDVKNDLEINSKFRKILTFR